MENKAKLTPLTQGDDTLYGEGGWDVLIATTGNDRLYGGLGDDALPGGVDDDYLEGNGVLLCGGFEEVVSANAPSWRAAA